VVLAAMLFFSSLASSVLESAMSIIFIHRVRHRPRSLVVSLLLPYLYILLLSSCWAVAGPWIGSLSPCCT
jgi:hypothetical protein